MCDFSAIFFTAIAGWNNFFCIITTTNYGRKRKLNIQRKSKLFLGDLA